MRHIRRKYGEQLSVIMIVKKFCIISIYCHGRHFSKAGRQEKWKASLCSHMPNF